MSPASWSTASAKDGKSVPHPLAGWFPFASCGLLIVFLGVAIKSKLNWEKLIVFLLMIMFALIELRAFFLIIS
jgi:hypothetical protein